MPSTALPAGWVDTGITVSYRTKGTVQFSFAYAVLNPAPEGTGGAKADSLETTSGGKYPWQIFSYLANPYMSSLPNGFNHDVLGAETASPFTIGIGLTGPNGSGVTNLSLENTTATFDGPADGHETDYTYASQSYAYQETGGPFRLGYQWTVIDPNNSDAPQFAQKHYQLVWGWFADANSVVATSFGSHSCQLYWMTGGVVGTAPPPTGTSGPLQSVGINALEATLYGIGPRTGVPYVIWTSLSLNCSPTGYQEWGVDQMLDMSELDSTGGNIQNGGIVGDAAHGAIFYRGIGFPYSASANATPPWRFANDVRCDRSGTYDAGTLGSGLAHVLDNIVAPQSGNAAPATSGNRGYLTDGCSYYEIPVTSWQTHYKVWDGLQRFVLDTGWAAAQSPPLWSLNDYDIYGQPIDPTKPVYESRFDLTLPIKGPPGRYSPEYLVLGGSAAIAGFAQIDAAGSLASDSSQKVSIHAGGAVTGAITATRSSDTAGTIGGSVTGTGVSGAINGSLSGALTGAFNPRVTITFSGTLSRTTGAASGATPNLAISITMPTLSQAINAAVSGYVVLPLGAGGCGAIFVRFTASYSNSATAVTAAQAYVSGGAAITASSVNSVNGVTIYQAGLLGGGPVTGSWAGSFSGSVSGQLSMAQQNYQPVTAGVPAAIDVERPDGNTPSNWVSSDLSKIVVTENTTNTALNVSATGAHVSRTLKTNWLNYIDMSNSGYPNYNLTNPDASADGYKTTKHNYKHDSQGSQTVYPEDVWWWETYSWLQVGMEASAAATPTLQVDYVILDVSDPHTTGSDRILNMLFTQSAGSESYRVPLASGLNTVMVDLRFPPAGGPAYLGRISALTLSNLATGTYTINSMKLSVRQDPNSSPAAAFAQSGFLKLGFGVPRQRKTDEFYPVDYSVPVASIDGSSAFGNIPDQANKADELGGSGGGLRYVDPITGAVSGIILDVQKSAGAFWEEFNRVEGWNVTYSYAVYNAANKDDEGNALGGPGGEMAQFAWNMLPFQKLAHAAGPPEVYQVKPPFSPVAAQAQIVQGLPFHFVAEHSIGGGIESQMDQGSARPTDAGVLQVQDAATAAVVVSAVTDWQGYDILAPVSANGIERWFLSKQ